MRKRFSPNTKLMVAIGGWGDTEGFSAGAKDETTRERFAKNVASMLDANGFDGVGKHNLSTAVSRAHLTRYRHRLGIPWRQRPGLQTSPQ